MISGQPFSRGSVFIQYRRGMVSDDLIIGGCIDGKRKAFNMLYRKYSSALLGVCMRYAHDKADAEDILQEGFIKIFTRIRDYRAEGSFEGWMKRIMINTAIDHYQQHLKNYFLRNVEDLAEEDRFPEEDDEDRDLRPGADIPRETLMSFIQELPEGYRMVFNLFAMEGFGHKEIAERLDISENTSKTQLMKARRSLRKKLEGWMKQTYILKR